MGANEMFDVPTWYDPAFVSPSDIEAMSISDGMLAELERCMPIMVVDPGPMGVERIDEARLRDRLTNWVASKRSMDRRDLSAGAMLEGLAAVARRQGQAERAGRLFGAARAVREAIGAPIPPVARADYERELAAMCDALGELGSKACAEGRALSPPEAIAYALGETELD